MASKLVYWNGSAWTDSDQTGLTQGAEARFASFLGYCFMTNGEEIYTSSDGASWGTTNLLNTVTISSASYSDPTVTLTVPGGHGVEVGDSITVSGLAPSGYNGTFTVTAVTDTTIEYENSSLGALTDTEGSLTVQFALAANDVLVHSNVLFLIGLKGYRSDIMWSSVPEKDDFSSDYTIEWSRGKNVSVKSGDGEELMAGYNYRGALYLFKNSAIARTSMPVEANGIKYLSDNIGANSKHCIEVVGEQLIFFCDGNRNAKKGFYSYNSLTDAEPLIISEPVQHYIDGMTAGETVYAGTIDNLYLAYIGSVTNRLHNISMTNCYLVFDTKTNRWLGAYDYPHTARAMTKFVRDNIAKPYVGDNDGTIWKLDYGSTDADTGSGGEAIEYEAISQPYDISSPSGIRKGYAKRTVKNIWVFGDNLNGVKFAYRFDKRKMETGGWQEIGSLKAPVHHIPVRNVEAHLFQFKVYGIGKNEDEPIIRKVVLEYE